MVKPRILRLITKESGQAYTAIDKRKDIVLFQRFWGGSSERDLETYFNELLQQDG